MLTPTRKNLVQRLHQYWFQAWYFACGGEYLGMHSSYQNYFILLLELV